MKIADILQLASKKRIPISAQIEITRACNFRCAHCYIPPTDSANMSFEDYKDYLDQIKELGGRFVNITGGEPLLHPEFQRIYLYTLKKGFVTNIYSNGSCIDRSLVKLFKEYPPKFIEISIYGASEGVYRDFTNRENEFSNVMAGIDLLLSEALPIRLKTFITRANYEDFHNIRAIVNEKHGEEGRNKFKYDYKVLPRLDGQCDNVKCQISPIKAVQMEMDDGMDRVTRWEIRRNDEKYKKTSSMECGCGRYSFQIDVHSNVNICTFHTLISRNLKEYDFKSIWEHFGKAVSDYNSQPREPTECDSCDYSFLCDNCPAITYSAKKGQSLGNSAVDYYCDVAKERYKVLMKNLQKQS